MACDPTQPPPFGHKRTAENAWAQTKMPAVLFRSGSIAFEYQGGTLTSTRSADYSGVKLRLFRQKTHQPTQPRTASDQRGRERNYDKILWRLTLNHDRMIITMILLSKSAWVTMGLEVGGSFVLTKCLSITVWPNKSFPESRRCFPKLFILCSSIFELNSANLTLCKDFKNKNN